MINYLRLGESLKFYEDRGYQRIEAPWWVPLEILNITSPEGSDCYFLEKNKKALVASGEQSFLYLANQGLLPKGKFQTITPCFRDEVQGPTRRKFFMKNELIIPYSNKKEDLDKVIDDAFSFLKKQVPDESKLKVIKTDIGYDIEYSGSELGSYGIRKCSFFEWVYGTGLAEPRTERAVNKK